MPKKDTDAPESTDPDAPPAEVAEATGAPTIDIEWNDRTWTVPASYGAAPAIAFRGIRRIGEATVDSGVQVDELADAVDVVESLLGRAQFRAWSKGNRVTLGDAFDLINTIVAAWGSGLGE